jgi:hypothetical protein
MAVRDSCLSVFAGVRLRKGNMAQESGLEYHRTLNQRNYPLDALCAPLIAYI